MRLITLDIYNLRGIRELHLQPGGKNLVVLGPNGSGKSAVVDAIDFLLTGNIARLSGRGTAGITLKQHGKRLGTQSRDVSVKARVCVGGQEFEISRCLAHEKELDCPDEFRPRIEPVLQMAHLGHHMLTRREILRFVTAEKGERGREIQALLDLQDVDSIRQAFNSAAKSLEGELKSRKREEEQASSAVCLALGIDRYDSQNALQVINDWRSKLGGSPIVDNSLRDLKRDLQPPSATQPLAVNLAGLQRHVESIGNILGDEAIQRRLGQYNQLQEALQLVRENPGLSEDLNALELIRIGSGLLDESGKCPLCQTSHPAGYLQRLLEERASHAREAQKIQTVILEALESLDGTAVEIRWVLNDLYQAAGKAGMPAQAGQLSQWLQSSESFSTRVEKDLETYALSSSPDSYALLGLPPDFPHRLEEILAALESHFPETTPEQDAWDQLTRLEVHLQNLGRARQALHQTQLSHAAAQTLKARYELVRNQVLESLYQQVCERFAELYRDLHGADESHFSAQLVPDGAGIAFQVNFRGHGAHPPHALHSEGHQDSMGVCLFLALAERLTQGKLDLIVLDDVVMSVDIAHRKQLGELLVRRFPHRQFLITTHDRVWATQLRNAGLVNSKGVVQFYDWDFDSGPLLSEITDLWDLVEADLDRGEVSAAAAKLRRGLEEFACHACDSLGAKVRFAMDSRWELGDLLPAAVEQYRVWQKKAIVAANSWGRTALRARLVTQAEHDKAIIEQRNIIQWMINPCVHYNTWADMTPQEFRLVVEAHRQLVSLFYCPDCNSLLFLVEEDRNPANLRCPCGEVNWNLVEKPKLE